jgi:glycosyltransferase involved in cell wall biosynthesis
MSDKLSSLLHRVGGILIRSIIGKTVYSLKGKSISAEAQAVEEYFDEAFYLSQNPVISDKRVKPIDHYLKFGWKQGLDPSPDFSTSFYINTYPDIGENPNIQPFLHYVLFGKKEGRITKPVNLTAEEIEAARAEFDVDYYLSQQPDIKSSDLEPLEHYLYYGWKEGFDPSPDFSTKFYLKNYSVIDKSGLQPFVHYVMHGKQERREPAPYYKRDLKNFQPLVSIIVPNFNHARFLPERFESIRKQTYSNYELIILDDCSKDNSIEVLDKLAQSFSCPVKKIYNKQNSGNPFAQWERGMLNASGQLIWICESDDFCDDDFLELLVRHFADRSVMLAFGGIQFCDQNGKHLEGMDGYREGAESGIWNDVVSRPACDWFSGAFGVNNVIANVGGCIFRNQDISKAVWEEARTYKIAGDWFLYSHILQGGAMIYDPLAIAYFRQHDANTSATNFNKLYYYEEHQKVMRNLCGLWNIPVETRERFISNVRFQFNHHKMPEEHGDFNDYFPVQELLDLECDKPHILLGMLGFIPGGGEVFPINLANALIKKGYLVSIFALSMFEQNKAMLNSLDSRVPVYHTGDLMKNGAQEFLDCAGVSVIHTHMASCDDFFFNNDHPLSNFPYVVSLHGSHDTLGTNKENLISKLIDGVTYWVYTADKNLDIFHNKTVNKRHLTKIPNAMPVDEQSFPKSREEMGIAADAIVFTLVARGIKRKGWLATVAAFQKLQRECTNVKVHLVLVGEGEEADNAVQNIKSGDAITYLGYQSKINGLYRISDCALVPTRFEGESFPLCLIQALQEKTPVIATNVGEIKSMISIGRKRAGILLENIDDTELFTNNLFEAMSTMTTKARRERFKKNTAEMVLKFDMDKMTERYLGIYSSAIEIEKLKS